MGLASLGSMDNFILDFSHIMNMIMGKILDIWHFFHHEYDLSDMIWFWVKSFNHCAISYICQIPIITLISINTIWLSIIDIWLLILYEDNDILNSRGYTDRKKKIIREWNKTNSSPRWAFWCIICIYHGASPSWSNCILKYPIPCSKFWEHLNLGVYLSWTLQSLYLRAAL